MEPLVRAIFNEKYPRILRAEENALREINDPRADDLLLAGLNHKQTRWNAADALGILQVRRAVDPLIAIVRGAHDKTDRMAAATALGLIKDPRASAPLCGALKDRNVVVRRFVAEALGELGDAGAVDPLSAALKDRDDGVRWNAANSLGDLKDARAVGSLVAALNDSEEYVQKSVADALGKIGDPSAVAPLIAAFRSSSAAVQWHVAVALGNFRNPLAANLLNTSLKEGRLDVIAAAHAFFIRKGDPDSEPALIEALNKYGDYGMAQDYLICRNSRLADAARRWALTNNVENMALPEERSLVWGSDEESR